MGFFKKEKIDNNENSVIGQFKILYHKIATIKTKYSVKKMIRYLIRLFTIMPVMAVIVFITTHYTDNFFYKMLSITPLMYTLFVFYKKFVDDSDFNTKVYAEEPDYIQPFKDFFTKQNQFSFLYELSLISSQDINKENIEVIKEIFMDFDTVDLNQLQLLSEMLKECEETSKTQSSKISFNQQYAKFLKENDILNKNYNEINGHLNLKDIL